MIKLLLIHIRKKYLTADLKHAKCIYATYEQLVALIRSLIPYIRIYKYKIL